MDIIKIRPYTAADLCAVAEIFTESVQHLTGSRYSPEQRQVWAPTPPDLKHWRARMLSLMTLVADTGTQLRGFLSYQPDGYIDLLYVRPGFERTGIASQLYACVEASLIRTARAAYTEASLIAEPFFKSRGFHAIRFEEIKIQSTILQRWVMRKSFGRP